MAYYQYYQSGGPWQNSWGTNAYQFQAPPVPTYVPQSSWGGVDWYNAHYGGQADSSYFDYIWSKVNRQGDYSDSYDRYPEDVYGGQVRSLVGASAASRGEAEHWHRRVYGGFVQLNQLMPRDIGAAAGWETVRLWQSNNTFYSNPMSGVREREREAIIGLAIAEAARLWQYVGRPLDKYGRREAGEVAAATAARIFVQMYDYDSPYDSYRSGRWAGSTSDRYLDDDDNRSYRRRGSFSNYGGSNYGSVSPYSYGGGSMPIAVPGAGYGYNGSTYGGGLSPYAAGQYLSASPYYGTASPMAYGYAQPTLSASPGQVIIHSDSSSGRRRHRSSSRHGHHHHRRHRSSSSVSYVPTAYSAGSYI